MLLYTEEEKAITNTLEELLLMISAISSPQNYLTSKTEATTYEEQRLITQIQFDTKLLRAFDDDDEDNDVDGDDDDGNSLETKRRMKIDEAKEDDFCGGESKKIGGALVEKELHS
ncbi:hypothetical protein Bca4012_083400 [Brassica carinata]